MMPSKITKVLIEKLSLLHKWVTISLVLKISLSTYFNSFPLTFLFRRRKKIIHYIFHYLLSQKKEQFPSIWAFYWKASLILIIRRQEFGMRANNSFKQIHQNLIWNWISTQKPTKAILKV